ncbi:MAG: hypothetical protein P4L36_12015 [Holophaga sp.]|nr:hypothetical protein [Holophaga sp.]
MNVLTGAGASDADWSRFRCTGPFQVLPDGSLLVMQPGQRHPSPQHLDLGNHFLAPFSHHEVHLSPGETFRYHSLGALCCLSDGSFLVSEMMGARVWRFDRETGLLSVFAGSGVTGAHLGGSVLGTELCQPDGLLELPDRSVLIVDKHNHRILRAHPDGTVTLFPGSEGRWVDASTIGFYSPTGLLRLPNGEMLIADTGNGRVLRMGLDGSITVALDESTLVNGKDHSPYRKGAFSPANLALLADGSVQGSFLFADAMNHQVFRVHPDGHITVFAGCGVPASGPRKNIGSRIVAGDPCATELNRPSTIVVLPDHRVLIHDTANQRILAISPPDHLQQLLENLVDRGMAAAARQDDPGVEAVREAFTRLLHPRATGPGLDGMPTVLLNLVEEYLVLPPLEGARIRQAGASLERQIAQAYPGEISGQGSSRSSSSSSNSSSLSSLGHQPGVTESKEEARAGWPPTRKRGMEDRDESERRPKQSREESKD